MEAIPVPTRKRIIELYDQGETTEEIAERVGYCVAAVRRIRQQFHERGTLQPQTHRCGRKGSFTDELQQRLRECVANRPDATLTELRDAMKVDVAISTIDRWTKKLDLSFKKSRCVPVSSSVRT
jgi:transposase